MVKPEIIYVCELCGSFVAQDVPRTRGGREPLKSEEIERLLEFSPRTVEEDRGGRAVWTPPTASLKRPWRRVPVSRDGCGHCSGGSDAAAAPAAADDGGHLQGSGDSVSMLLRLAFEKHKRTLEETRQLDLAEQFAWSRESMTAAEFYSSPLSPPATMAIANDNDPDGQALNPQPQLAGRLCVVTSLAPDSPFVDAGDVTARDAPIITLTPATRQTSPSSPCPARSIHQEGPISFERDEQGEEK
ncbi:hypothetical protein PG993_006664 [Apiospora rasikravindrae]|uniref:Uncharacterized protein n=1 Tax=Apiospora rasikravindrae TaxID=990691 RepID=A0ABR1T7Z1_9PEZI